MTDYTAGRLNLSSNPINQSIYHSLKNPHSPSSFLNIENHTSVPFGDRSLHPSNQSD
jgi:hypothetical protein